MAGKTEDSKADKTTVIVSSKDSRLQSVFSNRFVSVVTLIIICAIVLGVGLYLYRHVVRKSAPQKLTYQQQLDKDYIDARAAVNALGNKSAHTAQDRQQQGTAYMNLAQAAYNKQDYQVAVSGFENALAVNPEAKNKILGGLTYAYEYSHQHDKAISTCDAYIASLKSVTPQTGSTGQQIAGFSTVCDRLRAGQTI